jgi:hypothetical protein
MPTLGAHVSDEEFKAVELAAEASPERKVGPYCAEAIRERLRREGLMPGADNEQVAKLTAKVAAAVRKDPTLTERIEAVIGKSTRRQLAPA